MMRKKVTAALVSTLTPYFLFFPGRKNTLIEYWGKNMVRIRHNAGKDTKKRGSMVIAGKRPEKVEAPEIVAVARKGRGGDSFRA